MTKQQRHVLYKLLRSGNNHGRPTRMNVVSAGPNAGVGTYRAEVHPSWLPSGWRMKLGVRAYSNNWWAANELVVHLYRGRGTPKFIYYLLPKDAEPTASLHNPDSYAEVKSWVTMVANLTQGNEL